MPEDTPKEKQEKLVSVLESKEKVVPDLTENALKVVEKRYLLKDHEGKPIETPAEMFQRIARHIAKVDASYGAKPPEVAQTEEEFYEAMARLEFVPNSPTFWGSGTALGQLSACFVLPVEDNMLSILKTQMDMGLIHKSGGGTGFSFSRLRPAHSIVGTTGGAASGPVGFMQMYNDTSQVIKEGGRRRGANMGILRIDHPDILDFISYKNQEGTLSNFNISVAATDLFMKAVEEGTTYDLINPHTGKKAGELNAREVFDKIVQGAWANGEPGVVFIDKINAKNPTPALGEIESTNPCGEQPLLPYESCNLGSINLGLMVKTNTQGETEIDWDKLDQTVSLAVHFLDNVIDANKFPIPEIAEMTKKTRKIGLGVMGLADLFFQLGIPYDSAKGLEMSEKIMKRVTEKSHVVSAEIAKSRSAFPAFKGSIWDKRGKKMRNATTTTIAPTGTISMIASASSGIEPIFALVYTKTVMDGTALVNVNKYFEEALKKAGIESEELIQKVAKNNGSIQTIEEIPEKIRRIFVTAGDIAPEWHVKIQAAFQKHTDNAISKTINFPNSATVEDVEKSYLLAYELGCKGITVYRDGSRVEQVLTTGVKEGEKKASTSDESESRPEPTASRLSDRSIGESVGKEPAVQSQAVVATGVRIIPRERPDVIRGYTYRIKTAYGKLFVTINDDEEGQPFEIFSHLGKAGGFFAAKAEAICRLISLALRSGIDPEEVIDQIKGIRGPTPSWSEEGKMILSLPDAIAQILDKHIHREQPNLDLDFKTPDALPAVTEEKIAESVQMSDGFSTQEKQKSLADIGEAPACPECGGMLEFSEGCLKCPSCGYSKCS